MTIPDVSDTVYLKAMEINRNREENYKKFHACLKARICPKCGEELKFKTHYDDCENEPHDYDIYTCKPCDFRYQIDH